MPDDVLDHVSLSGSAARMSASASALPPPSEADEDIANLQDLAPDGSAAASGGCSWSLPSEPPSRWLTTCSFTRWRRRTCTR